jgi:hypothetical protein
VNNLIVMFSDGITSLHLSHSHVSNFSNFILLLRPTAQYLLQTYQSGIIFVTSDACSVYVRLAEALIYVRVRNGSWKKTDTVQLLIEIICAGEASQFHRDARKELQRGQPFRARHINMRSFCTSQRRWGFIRFSSRLD